MDRPRAVAEVAFELAEDGRDGERRERDAAVRVVAVDRLDEAEVRDLAQVIQWLTRVAVLDRERTREWHVLLDQAGSRLAVALARTPPQVSRVAHMPPGTYAGPLYIR